MPSWEMLVPPLILAVVSIAAFFYQGRAWRAVPTIADERERDFRQRQLRRRMQVSVMLGLIGLGMILGLYINQQQRPNLFVGFWSGLMLVVLWVIALALVDARANYQFWTTSRRRALMEHAKLKAELARREPEKRNGHASPP